MGYKWPLASSESRSVRRAQRVPADFRSDALPVGRGQKKCNENLGLILFRMMRLSLIPHIREGLTIKYLDASLRKCTPGGLYGEGYRVIESLHCLDTIW